ncbi:MAG: T9SS type A sorting domain-containing protein, partial [Bacteroidetes bacterium]|nr:T9SS type A sorting domain-containing protein [Bacteroidota bacterium]
VLPGYRIELYPNPVSHKLYMIINGVVYNNIQIQIFNMLGEKVYDGQGLSGNTIHELDLSARVDGIYITRILVDGAYITRKFTIVK